MAPDKDPDQLLKDAMLEMDKGHYKEAEAICKDFCNNVPQEQKTEKRMIEWHLVSAREHTARSEYTDAVGHCMKALKTAQELKDETLMAGILRWLGHIHWRKGDYHLALEYLNEGVEKAKAVKDRKLEGTFLIELGNVLGALGDPEQAAEKYREAIKIMEDLGVEDELSRAYNNLADSYATRGQWETAAGMFRHIKDMFKTNPVSRGWASFNRAECLLELGRMEEAGAELDEAIPLLEGAGDDLGRAITYYIQGMLFAKRGDWDKAAARMDQSLRMIELMDLPTTRGHVLRSMARMHLWKGDKEKARRLFEEAAAIFKEHNAVNDLTRLKRDMARLV